jgi:hypothetical protein
VDSCDKFVSLVLSVPLVTPIDFIHLKRSRCRQRND